MQAHKQSLFIFMPSGVNWLLASLSPTFYTKLMIIYIYEYN